MLSPNSPTPEAPAESSAASADLPPWRVAHTRPRCEKKIAEKCLEDGLETSLPLYRSVKKYRGKTVVFRKPLFPGYVFFRGGPTEVNRIRQDDNVANVLIPPDPAEFAAQLADILRALETDCEIRLAPHITNGVRVKIVTGPLRGLEGIVDRRSGSLEVHLRLDFIGQSAALRVAADELEPI